MSRSAKYWIEHLDLKPHPEGGYYRETHRSNESIPEDALPKRFGGKRSFSTAIYFLLEGGAFSALHRIHSDELWHFYDGAPLTVVIIDEEGKRSNLVLGRNVDNGERLQVTVPAGVWFGAHCNDEAGYSLVGCTVSPGFDFNDFEMGARGTLLDAYPEHKGIITALTHTP